MRDGEEPARRRLRLQPNEEGVFGNWFRELAQGEQRVTGGTAAGFLKKSGIPTHQLKQIWDVCDASRLGSIDQVHIASACTQALSAHMCTHPRDACESASSAQVRAPGGLLTQLGRRTSFSLRCAWSPSRKMASSPRYPPATRSRFTRGVGVCACRVCTSRPKP
jgi:hypothetical protein